MGKIIVACFFLTQCSLQIGNYVQPMSIIGTLC